MRRLSFKCSHKFKFYLKMLPNINIKDVNITQEAVDKILKFVKSSWDGIPKWLRTLLITVIISGAGYFLYTRLQMSYDVESLQEEIAILNEKCATTVFYDRYIYDIANLVDATQNLEYEIDLLYEHHNEMMNLILEYIQRHHGDDDIIMKEIKSLQSRMQSAKNSYDKVLQYQISLYNDWNPEKKHFDKYLINPNDTIKK